MIKRFFSPYRIRLHKGAESYDTLYNPERGWYFITRIELDEQVQVPGNYLSSRNGLELLEINLMKYRDRPLSEKALLQLCHLLILCREAKKKLILRFTYDMVGNCPATEPSHISMIFRHMDNLKGIFYEFQDCIFIYQGIFMGSWGEMHDSKFANTVDIQKLFQKLISVTADNSYIAVRTPALYRVITQCLGVCYKKDSMKGKGYYRLALFNDSFASSPTDFGTYGEVSRVSARHYNEKWCREDELNFQYELTARTPSGGETSALYEDMSMEEVINELQQTGMSYLNNEYHPDVMERWQKTMIEKGPYKGKSYYDFIGNHLGYRFVIQKVFYHQNHERITIHVQLINKGFAPIYREKALRLLLHAEGISDVVIEQDKGIAGFRDGMMEIEFMMMPNQVEASAYTIYFQIYDHESDRLIACANHGFHEYRGNEIGVIQKK